MNDIDENNIIRVASVISHKITIEYVLGTKNIAHRMITLIVALFKASIAITYRTNIFFFIINHINWSIKKIISYFKHECHVSGEGTNLAGSPLTLLHCREVFTF